MSKNIRFACPYCGRQMSFEHDLAGMDFDCPTFAKPRLATSDLTDPFSREFIVSWDGETTGRGTATISGNRLVISGVKNALFRHPRVQYEIDLSTTSAVLQRGKKVEFEGRAETISGSPINRSFLLKLPSREQAQTFAAFLPGTRVRILQKSITKRLIHMLSALLLAASLIVWALDQGMFASNWKMRIWDWRLLVLIIIGSAARNQFRASFGRKILVRNVTPNPDFKDPVPNQTDNKVLCADSASDTPSNGLSPITSKETIPTPPSSHSP